MDNVISAIGRVIEFNFSGDVEMLKMWIGMLPVKRDPDEAV